MPQGFDIDSMQVVRNQYASALKQLGTLGGGNHFIELQKDGDGLMWIMIHSGSRNLGKLVGVRIDVESSTPCGSPASTRTTVSRSSR